MNTGSLRRRIIMTTLPVLAVVLAAVVTAVTLLYRASLDRDLERRLTAAAGAMRQAWPAGQAKQLAFTLALEGIATDIVTGPPNAADPATAAAASARPDVSVARHDSLLVVRHTLPDGTQITYSASEVQNDRAVQRLLAIEIAVSLAALAVATLLVMRAATTALHPLTEVARTARRIASGERSQRLRPSRTDTQLGGMAAAFDQMLDALEAAITRAEHAETAMRNFLADASHELRTPIAALQASAEVLLREQPPRPERDTIEASLARDAVRLGRLVDDVLGLARAETQQQFAELDLNALIRQLADQAAERAPGTRITLGLGDRAMVHGDPDALRRLMHNLLDNALAAVPRTGGAVSVSVQRTDEHIEVRITDNGPGIPDAERERIFERYVRLTRSVPGHGLGLAIARRIARLHHGDLVCDAAATGAAFTLHLPPAAAGNALTWRMRGG
ncbi:HAMP domain-containing sensor histidine kinase [Dactylosporangium darangshiense]|uniref:histidine kinase n=2 Tax=Dactylosporangium darangshiense TaxID=579108 RepID=A0ABP8DQM9_9ACTN